MRTIALGDSGPAVVEIRSMLQKQRLLPIGEAAPDPQDPVSSVYDSACVAAVRRFQQERGLLSSGQVDADTYQELLDSQYRLGDRDLSLTSGRLQRGDDVRRLQGQLGELGFHHGNVDGIFGPGTEGSVRAFQNDYGLRADGVCGPETARALGNLLPKVTGGSAPLLRSRAHRRNSGPQLAGRHIYLSAGDDIDGFTWNIAHRVRDLLELLGANTTLSKRERLVSTSAEQRAEHANRSGAELFIKLRVADQASEPHRGAATYYFGSPLHVSRVGQEIADFLHRELIARTRVADGGVHPRVLEILRLTRMPAVLVEFGGPIDDAERARLREDQLRALVAESVVAALQRFYLSSPDDQPTGTWRVPAFD
ncbi:N-acetylmuramoyl-L-alanine amidase [Blastococcus sp. Marseille-P5729]|uniref:N-acetylmuramoyl-L-alanine amidase n=1 Tax=Blastococcus sp. Marseille-P5729 TaxID=2086582 RepID=UPI000D10A4B1|nr:peptidoglycan-binding protein [Blastococcus sp. Marseille-P5729]